MIHAGHGDGSGREAILRAVLDILAGMAADGDGGFGGPVGPGARLGADLGLESIQIVRLVLALQERFGRRDLPFQALFMPRDGQVADPRIADLVEFLGRHLGGGMQEDARAQARDAAS